VSREAVSDVWDALSATGALRPHWRGLPGTDAATHAQVLTHLRSPGLADWSASAARVGFCAHLIRLVGSSATVIEPRVRSPRPSRRLTLPNGSPMCGAATTAPIAACPALARMPLTRST
jgi:hypothetical protein